LPAERDDHNPSERWQFDVIILQLVPSACVHRVISEENAVSKLSALSRHEFLVRERRLLRAIGRAAVTKPRPALEKLRVSAQSTAPAESNEVRLAPSKARPVRLGTA
jgi:hypothetical protein